MKKEISVLIIEDVPADVVLINHELRKGGLAFRSKRVGSRDEFVQELQQRTPDLILSDHGLPQFDGFSALAIAQSQCPDVPFLFVTGSMGEEVAIESLKSGATDYVLKNRLRTLVPAVLRALRQAEERRTRVETERALEVSEEHFRTLVEGVKDYAIFMLDAKGNITSWNTGAEWIIGYPANEIIGRSFECLHLSEDIAGGQPQKILELAAGQGRGERDGWRVRKGGGRFWASTSVTALRTAAGGLRGFAVVTRDITARKLNEEVLARQAAIIQGSDDAIISKTLEGVITSWNPGAERIFGYVESEAVGQSMLMIIPPERSEEEVRILAAITHGERVSHFETVRLTKSGQPVEVSISISPILDAAGRVTGAANIARDITVQKRAQEQLRHSEARHTAILEAALDAIISLDQEGVIREWNAAAERMFGYPRTAAIGQPMDMLMIPPSLLETYRDGLAQYLILGVGSLIGRPIELTARRAGGEEFAIELGITPIPDSAPPHYTAIIRDITARKAVEAEIRRLQAELEQRVRDRTAELEVANQELESFSYSVSHDLRAPLRHIAGFVDMLQARSGPALDEEGRRLVESIAESTSRMTRLIEALLSFSRLGRTELHKTRLSLDALIRGAQRELRNEARGRNVEWIIGSLPDVAGDPVLLQQVMINLLSNALKYTRVRPVARIEIAAQTERNEIVIKVRDNGVGFDMRYVDKLFGVFQRLHRASEFEGTGIGLASARLVINRHGGRIWAEGKVDQGATVCFSLPVAGGGRS